MKIGYTILRVNGEEERGDLILWPDLPIADAEARLRAGDAYEQVRKELSGVFGDNHTERVNVFWDTSVDHDAVNRDTSLEAPGAHYTDMFVDENGLLKDLPSNGQASAVYRNNVLWHKPGRYDPEQLPPIVGDAVLFDRKVWF